jgi:hypothetical protein
MGASCGYGGCPERIGCAILDKSCTLKIVRVCNRGVRLPYITIEVPKRACLSFRAVNIRDRPGYDPGLQRHHLLPRQLLGKRCFSGLFEAVGRDRMGFDDFRSNGLLLPANDRAVLRMGLPLHRGPHRDYNALVIERVGQVEAAWSARRLLAPEVAIDDALMRLGLLQRALRHRLLDPVRKRLSLNRHDPLGKSIDFSELDAMAEALWPETDVLEQAHQVLAASSALAA